MSALCGCRSEAGRASRRDAAVSLSTLPAHLHHTYGYPVRRTPLAAGDHRRRRARPAGRARRRHLRPDSLVSVQESAPLLARAGRHAPRRALVVRRDVCAGRREVGLPVPGDRRAGAGGGRAAAHAPQSGQRAGVPRPRGLPTSGHTRGSHHRQAPGLRPRRPRCRARGGTHAARAAPGERAGDEADRAVPRPDEGPTAPDASPDSAAGHRAQARAAAMALLWAWYLLQVSTACVWRSTPRSPRTAPRWRSCPPPARRSRRGPRRGRC